MILPRSSPRIVLGFDPGTRITGYCVLEVGQKTKILDWGAWKLGPTLALGERLEILFENACALIKKWNPHVVGLEKAVVFKNIPSSLTLSEARGILRLALHTNLDQAAARLVELSPTLVKKSTTGRGLATKDEMKQSLGFRWGFNFASDALKGFPADAFDALAIATSAALVHNRQHGLKTRSAVLASRKRTKGLDHDPENR